MEINLILNIIESLGILAVMVGIWIGIKQLKLGRNQRRDLAVMECARSFEDIEFTQAYELLSNLNKNHSISQREVLEKEYESAAFRVGMKFETIGLLVYKGVVPIDAMEDLVGGAAIFIWDILHPWIMKTRENRGHPTMLEWYQWLVDRLQERDRVKRPPAYDVYKDWKSNF